MQAGIPECMPLFKLVTFKLKWKKILIMETEERDVKVKMSICPECGNAIRVAVEHTMDTKSKNEFAKEVMKHDLRVKTISLDEYRSSNIQMYCKGNCSRKKL